jgi:hypothetical protein
MALTLTQAPAAQNGLASNSPCLIPGFWGLEQKKREISVSGSINTAVNTQQTQQTVAVAVAGTSDQ